MLASVGFASSRQRTFRLLRRRTLKQRVNLPVGPVVFRRRGPWEAVKQGHRGGDVLACPSEVRESPIIGEDPSMHITGRGACEPTVSAMLDLLLDVSVFLDKLLPGVIDLQLSFS